MARVGKKPSLVFRLKVIQETCSKMGFDLGDLVEQNLGFDCDDIPIETFTDPMHRELRKYVRHPYSPEELKEARVLAPLLESRDSKQLDRLMGIEPRQIVNAFHIARLERDSPEIRYMAIVALAYNRKLNPFVITTTNWDTLLEQLNDPDDTSATARNVPTLALHGGSSPLRTQHGWGAAISRTHSSNR